MKNRNLLGTLLLLLTAMIWGTAFAAQRVGMETIEPITFTAARMCLAAAAVGLTALIVNRTKSRPASRQKAALTRRNTLLGGICCGFFLASASLFQQIGIVHTTAGKAGFITALYMLLVPILQFVLFRKRQGWLIWAAVLIGVAGMYLLCVREGFSLARGDALVCICAVLFSGHILCCDHFTKRGDPIGISALQFLVTALVSAVIAFLFEEPSWEKVRSAVIPIVYCGIVSGGIGYTLQMVAQRFTDPTIASLLMSLESVFAVLAGVLLLHERMSLREGLGCLIMFAAIVMVQLPQPTAHGETPGEVPKPFGDRAPE